MQKDKVSVVVPVYKVEKYIHRCIDSILEQTYPNLEIILVNDGSPDTCGSIINSYQKEDARVKAFHKANGGLSDARNYGMKRVTGEFTMFVDSDDWLDPYMIETMIKHSKTYEADIVQSAFYYAYDDKLLVDHRYYNTQDDPIQLERRALMYELVKNETVKNFAWGKLYRTELIKDIRFEKGVLFEDVFWAHHVMHKVNKYVMIHQPFYYYYQRDDSIVATYTPENLDIIRGLRERHLFIEKYYGDLTDESYKLILKTCFIHYHLLKLNRKIDDKGIYRKEIKIYIRSHLQPFKQAVQNNQQLKRQLFLFNLHPALMIFFQRVITGLRKMKLLSGPVGLKQVDVS